MIKPQLWIIAGTNGAGKSTLVDKYLPIFADKIELINPDNIARELAQDPRYPTSSVQIKAGKEAIKKQRLMLENKESFIIETTFSGHHEIKLLKQAKEKDYKTNLVFIGISNVIANVSRVEYRVQQNGHFVDYKDIIRRYGRSLENLKNNYKSFDRVFIFDNSFKKHVLKLSLENNKIKFKAKEQTSWILDNVKISTKDSQLER